MILFDNTKAADEHIDQLSSGQYQATIELVKSNAREVELRREQPVHPEISAIEVEIKKWNEATEALEEEVFEMNNELDELRKDNMRNALSYSIGGVPQGSRSSASSNSDE